MQWDAIRVSFMQSCFIIRLVFVFLVPGLLFILIFSQPNLRTILRRWSGYLARQLAIPRWQHGTLQDVWLFVQYVHSMYKQHAYVYPYLYIYIYMICYPTPGKSTIFCRVWWPEDKCEHRWLSSCWPCLFWSEVTCCRKADSHWGLFSLIWLLVLILNYCFSTKSKPMILIKLFVKHNRSFWLRLLNPSFLLELIPEPCLIRVVRIKLIKVFVTKIGPLSVKTVLFNAFETKYHMHNFSFSEVLFCFDLQKPFPKSICFYVALPLQKTPV